MISNLSFFCSYPEVNAVIRYGYDGHVQREIPMIQPVMQYRRLPKKVSIVDGENS
jgi:hypothetical protein